MIISLSSVIFRLSPTTNTRAWSIGFWPIRFERRGSQSQYSSTRAKGGTQISTAPCWSCYLMRNQLFTGISQWERSWDEFLAERREAWKTTTNCKDQEISYWLSALVESSVAFVLVCNVNNGVDFKVFDFDLVWKKRVWLFYYWGTQNGAT